MRRGAQWSGLLTRLSVNAPDRKAFPQLAAVGKHSDVQWWGTALNINKGA